MMASRRRPVLAPAVVVAAVLVVGGLYSALRDDGAPVQTPGGTASTVPRPPVEPPGVEEGSDEPPVLDDAGELGSYRVVYRVEAFGPGGGIVDTEVREVRRPFEARVETRAGAPPGDEVTTLSIWTFGVTEIGAIDQERATLLGEPVVPNGEVGTTADLDDAFDAGVLVHLRQQQRIAGRVCHRYRTGGPVDVVQLSAPTAGDFADLCVDAAGLVLGESWVVDGDLFRRRTAVEVDTDVELDDDRFEHVGDPPRFADGGGLIGEVTPDSQFPDVDHWALTLAPDGFEHRGRFSFTPSAGDAPPPVTGDAPGVVTGLSDVYEAGPEAVVVVNGGTSNDADALGDLSELDAVDLGELGTGHLRRRVRGGELLVRLEGGRFVKVHGTLSVDRLVEVARALVRLDGTGKTITALPPERGGEELPQPAPGDEGIPHTHAETEEPPTHEGGDERHTHR